VDWTQVLLALIAVVPGTIAAVGVLIVRRRLATPSGDPIGTVVERTHDLSSADLAMTTKVHDKITNGP
jgi:ABC-type Fe3+ transport system permease subunit